MSSRHHQVVLIVSDCRFVSYRMCTFHFKHERAQYEMVGVKLQHLNSMDSNDQNAALHHDDVRAYGKKFMSNKEEQYNRVRYDWEFSRFRSLSTGTDDYLAESTEREVAAQDSLWRISLHLQEIIFGNGKLWSDHQKKRLLRDLHDSFLDVTSKRCVSKPQFVGCFVKTLRDGYSQMNAADGKMTALLESVYNSFDLLSTEAFDWRRFLFYLHFGLDATRTVKEQILAAFVHIGDKPCTDLQDLDAILFPLVKADAIANILCLLDESWAEVCASKIEICADNKESTAVTSEVLQEMLDTEGLRGYFEQSTSSWGRGRVFPVCISRWEEELYTKTLLQLVVLSRREESIRDKFDCDRQKTKYSVYAKWLDYARNQGRMRSIFNKIICSVNLERKYRGLFALSQWRRLQFAATDIQRVFRGFLGRLEARQLRMIFIAARLIQTHYRIYRAKTILHALSSRYLRAIVEIQRRVRGAFGRRLALRKLLSLVDRQHRENVMERRRLEMERGCWCLTKLQACCRRKIAIAIVVALREKSQRELQIQRAMETDRKKFLRERQIYERQLEGFYRRMREDHDNSAHVETKVSHDQIQIRTLRRALKNEELKELKNSEPDYEYLATEEWNFGWMARIEAGVKEIKSHCLHCLNQPDNSSEKQMRLNILKRVKGRVTDVLKRADERHIPMETPEATNIAREEIIHIIGEEERTKLVHQMELEFVERQERLHREKLQNEAKAAEAHKRATIQAASLVAKACRKWLARRHLRRLCLDVYEKRFDGSSHAFYYYHRYTRDSSWTKPKAMGTADIPTKDEWVLLRDAHNFPYYLNPSSMNMRWQPPVDEEMCCGDVSHTWWKEFPVRVGRCPDFGRNLNDDGKRYCNECFLRCDDQRGL